MMIDSKPRPDPFGFDPAHVTDMRVEMASERDELPTDWPSQIVRRAAALMTERAKAAVSGPWHVETLGDGYPQRVSNPQAVIVAQTYTGLGTQCADAAHIAGLDPAVAVAIAEAWAHQADDMADHLAHMHDFGPPNGTWVVTDEREFIRSDWTATLKAALAYLREDAPKAVSADA